MRYWITLIAISLVGNAYAADPQREANLPLVPLEENQAENPAAPKKRQDKTQYENHQITVKPGVNQLVPVATGHLNRIVTPFASPQVRTTASSANTSVADNVVYIAPADEAPVSMYITEKGDESAAISLTLVPRRLPPRELAVSMGDQYQPRHSAAAKKWERGHPYENSLKKLLRRVAMGKIPQGYSLSNNLSWVPYCEQSGLNFEFKQAVMGHSFRVAVGLVTNLTNTDIEFREDACMLEKRVAAVAAWPNVKLAAGQQTEVYVVVHDSNRIRERHERRSLINAHRTSYGDTEERAKEAPWGVQVMAVRDERVAREHINNLRSKGYPIEPYFDGRFHYLRASGYESRDAAMAAQKELEKLGYNGIVVTRKR